MKKKRLQYSGLFFNTNNRAETDCQPQPTESSISFPYLQKPNITEGSENSIQASSDKGEIVPMGEIHY